MGLQYSLWYIFGDPSCIGFWGSIWKTDRHIYRQSYSHSCRRHG